MDFKDKVCVVTGGANGIGKALTQEFAEAGCKVAFIDVDRASGEQVLETLVNNGVEGMFFEGDIAEQAVLEDFVQAVVKKYKRIDYIINNACVSRRGIISGCSSDDFNYVLKVGVTAPYMLTKLFVKHLNTDACIINIASTRSNMSQADTESYTAAKGGIVALTHALAVSLAGKARVNAISPGWIDMAGTNQTDQDKNQHLVKRIGTPRDIAKMAMFLCSSDSGFITGQNITVDGGMTKLMIYSGDDGWEYNGN